ncbi:hypothetical protein [Fundidesulfovibrio soli]|uniref:hypothetical protein n=1 Tax=Fundidesulfovibrio soli TaxID=2922716 RepID=UPI001FAEE495|nr:hypothetical protein [Fundidesulfovibrio soli]
MFFRSLFLTLCLVFSSSACFAYSEVVEWLRQQSFNKCKKYYMGHIVDNFLQNPRWESGETADGEVVVNVRGRMDYAGKTVNALLQFTINSHNRSWNMNALELNGVPQDKDMRTALVEAMCESR